MNYSPLRYPGGKAKIAPLVQLLIKKTQLQNTTYVEPFAGGSGVALSLLMTEVVDQIVINDYDKAIYSVWRAIKEDSWNFIDLIRQTPVTIEELAAVGAGSIISKDVPSKALALTRAELKIKENYYEGKNK